jgi:hypothetical protein
MPLRRRAPLPERWALAAGCAALLGCSTAGDILTTPVPEGPVVRTPREADAFVDSVGIAVPVVLDEVPFDSVALPSLVELGVRHVRDFAPTPGDEAAGAFERLRRLADAGIRTQLILEPRFGVLPEHVDPIRNAMGTALEAVEGPNDNDANDVDLTAAEVRAFEESVRARLDAVPADPPSRVALVHSLDRTPGVGDLSAVLDYGNFERPRTTELPAKDLTEEKAAARAISGSRPLMVAECGYATIPEASNGVTEAAAAKYLPRLSLGHFSQGIARTFLADLADRATEPDVTRTDLFEGLLRQDSTRKSSFGALARLLALFDDPGPTFSVHPLEYEVRSRPEAFREVLVERRDGRYLLAVWLEVPSYDARTGADLEVTPEPVTIEFLASLERISVHSPYDARGAAQELPGESVVELRVPDHPLVVELVPTP